MSSSLVPSYYARPIVSCVFDSVYHMEQTLYAGSFTIPCKKVKSVFITIQEEDGTEFYVDVESIDIGHAGGFSGILGPISGNGNGRRVIR